MEAFDPAAATQAYIDTMSAAEMAKAVAYTRGGYWLILGGFVVGLAVALVLIKTNVLTGLRERFRNPWAASFVVGAAYVALSWILTLPWAIYASWHREKAYGLNNQTLVEWLSEAAVGAAISTVFTAIFIMLLYFLIRAAKRTWWMWGAGLLAGFGILGLILSPLVIEPLFNTYTPAPPGAVRDAVVELAHRTGTPDDKIFIYDGTKQSDRYTANVSGLFGSARVALSDAMFKKNADMSEIRAVVGHEMGHYVRGHILWTMGLLAILAVVGFWLVDRLFPLFKRLLGANRVGDISDPAGLPVLGVILSVLGLLYTPIGATITRVMETDADRFSLEYAREPDGIAKALIKTAEYRAPQPTPIEEFVFYDHPSVENRIRMAMDWKAEHMDDPPQAAASPPAVK